MLLPILRGIIVSILAVPIAGLISAGASQLYFLWYKSQNTPMANAEMAEDKGLWIMGMFVILSTFALAYLISVIVLWLYSKKLVPSDLPCDPNV